MSFIPPDPALQNRRIFDAGEGDEPSMTTRLIRTVAAGLCLSLAMAGSGLAQKTDDPTQKRIDGLEKQVRQLRSIITQAKDTGQPIQVRVSSDPDPVLEGLQTRLDDLEQAGKQRNDQIDTLTRDLAQARKDAADARDASKALAERLDKLEARLKAIEDNAAAAASAAAAAAAAPPPLPPPPGSARTAAPPSVAANTPQAQDAFKKAVQLLREGEYAQASRAFQSFVDSYGDSPNAPEARYWLGETLSIRGLYSDAAVAYIGAIRGFPTTSWAPDAMVKLSRALVQLNKPQDACRALDDFAKRYPSASPPVKARAADVRQSAMCV